MEEGLKIQIGADVTELIAGFTKATKLLQSFAQTGEASAKDVEKAIRQLSKATKGLSGEELERVNTLIAKLRDTSAQLGKQATSGVAALGASLQDLSKDAATVTPQIEKLSTAITNIPEGSFAVSLDADVASYLPKIEGASEALRQLGQTGIIAGNQAEAALLELGRAAQNAGTADLVKLNAAIAAIGTASDRFRATGAQAFDAFGNSVEQAAGKVAIIGPAISNAVKQVEVVKNQGFTIKINADTATAIQGLKFISKETRELGVTGEANVKQVEKALRDLNKQLKGGGGGAAEVERLKIAIAGLTQASANFNVDGSVKNLGVLESKAKSVDAALTNLNGATVTATFNTQGVEQSTAKVEILNAAVDRAEAQPDIAFRFNVEDTQAIASLKTTSTLIQEIGKTGVVGFNQVAQVLDELKIAASGLSGGALENINRIINEIQVSVAGLGATSTQVFDQLGNSIEGVDGDITINPIVNEANAVNNLEHVTNAAIEAKDRVEDIGAASPVIKVETNGIELSTEQIDKLDAELYELRANGDFELDVAVDAKQAIKNVDGLEDILDRLGRTGKLSLQDVQQAMRFLAESAKKPGANIAHINAAMEQLTILSKQFKNVGKTGFDQFGNAIDNTAKKLAKVRPASAQASDSLRDLGRIATDAPFGFIAISNNIQPLIDSLGNLTASAKGPLGALKALGGALIGPAGIGIAIAAVTGAVTYATQKYGSLGEAVDALFKKTNAAATAARELKKANEESFKTSGEELGRLKVLINVAQDKSRSDIERKDAVLELQRVYPSYFGNLSQEAILNGQSAAATRDATKAIYDKARAAAGAQRVQDLAGQELQNTADAAEATKKYTQALNELAEAKKYVSDNDLTSQQTVNSAGIAKNTGETIINEAIAKVNAAKSLLEKVGNESVDIQKKLNKTFELLTGGDIADKDKLRLKTLDDIVKKSQDLIDAGKGNKQIQDELNNALAEQYQIKAKAANVDAATIAAVSASIKAGTFKQKLDKESEKSLEKQIALLNDLRKTVGLNVNEEQKLLDLRVQAAALTLKEQGATPTQALNKINQVKTEFEIEGIDLAIDKLEKFGEILDLTRSKRENIFELKFKKIQLENPDLTRNELKVIAANLQEELDLNPLEIQIEYVVPKIDTSKIPKPDINRLTNPITGQNRETEKDEADELLEQQKKLADFASNTLTPVFTNLFDAIGKGGKTALQSLADSLKDILKKLAAAAIQAAIFAAILSLATGGAAGGGLSFVGALGQSQLGALFTRPNQANQNRRFTQGNMANMNVNVTGNIHGNTIRLVTDRVERSNQRLF